MNKDFSLRKVAIRIVDEPPLYSDKPIDSPQAAVKLLADTFKDYDREVVAVVNLKANLVPINMNIVSMGALDQSLVHPREALKSMILSNAAAVMMVHNHPSGRLNPSREDIAITDRMVQLCNLLGIKVMDHVIVGPGKDYYSFHEKGVMPLANLELKKDIEDIELEGLMVAENTERAKKTNTTLTVAECSEFHSMGEFHENVATTKEAIELFNQIPPDRMHGIPAIGIRVEDAANPDMGMEKDFITRKRIDLDILTLVPEIANDWKAQKMIAELIHAFPDTEIDGKIPEGVQKQLNFIESREKQASQLKAVTDQLEKGVSDVFQSDKYKEFLNVMAKFPRYSVNNSILIMMQKPDAQLCQSFTGWKEMGRFVKKGEKGLNILAPAPYKVEREVQKQDANGKPMFDHDGEPITEKQEITIRAFKVVKTFDLSQTDGKELPSLGVSELVGDVDGYSKLFEALKEVCPVPITFENIEGGSKGYYHQEEKKIAINEGMSEVQNVKTAIHEMAHQKLHDKDAVAAADHVSRNGKEVEAESVAYVVCQHYGINTSDYSFSYVAGWSEGKETPELKSALDKIRQTAADFIYQIDQKIQVLQADREQTQESPKVENPFVQELAAKITAAAEDKGFIPVVPDSQEKVPNPDLKVAVDKALENLEKKRTQTKKKTSVKSKIKEKAEKSETTPKKTRTTKAKEERA